MVYPITKFWFYPLCRLFIKRIKGKENIPLKGPFIIISNHRKMIDPMLITYIILRKLNKKTHYLSSAKWWFLGDTICRKWAGCIPLFNPNEAFTEMKEHLEKEEIIGIFPEGHPKKKKNKIKTGAVRLALEAKVPILPIAIQSSFIPFNSLLNIGELIHLEKNKESIEKKAENLMKQVYSLKE